MNFKKYMNAKNPSAIKQALLIIISIILIINAGITQNIPVIQFSSFCQGDINIEGKLIQERISSITQTESICRIEFVKIADCGMEFYPECHLNNDTLNFTITPIMSKTLILETNDTISTFIETQECWCAYEIKFHLKIDTLFNLKINNKILPYTSEIYKTFLVKYFVFGNDTTGIRDKYGMRQGTIITSKEEYLLKYVYKDDLLQQIEKVDLDGNLIKTYQGLEELYYKN